MDTKESYEPLPSISSQSHHLYPPNSSSSSCSNSIGLKPLSQIGVLSSNLNSNQHSIQFLSNHQFNLLKFNFSTLSTLANQTKNFRIQGWDPILIISQIILIQSLHYLTLSILIPTLLTIFSKPIPLESEGGSKNVGMIMDWREMVGYSTLHHSVNKLGDWAGYGKLPDSLGRRPLRLGTSTLKIHSGLSQPVNGLVDRIERALGTHRSNSVQDSILVDLAADSNRAWVLAISWFLASLIGVWYLYHIVRRPIHIMDHSLTINLNHLILTTYYSSSFPTSIWFYSILILSSILQIIWAENLCVKREMREGLGVGWKIDQRPEDHLTNNLNSTSVLGNQFNDDVVVNLNGVDHHENSLNGEG